MDIVVRPARIAEPSYVCYLQMSYYARTDGLRDVFEYYLLKTTAEYVHNPAGSCMWVAVDGEKIIGSIAIVRVDEHTAQLRWFVLHEDYQGRGIGSRLMDVAMQFCTEQGYTHVFLWTYSLLTAARHLYEKHGFVLTEEKPNTEWTDRELTEQRLDWHAAK